MHLSIHCCWRSLRNLEAPLEERDVGGLGIFLARKNVDEFRYTYTDGRNRNTFVIQLEPSANSPAGQHI